MPKFKSGDRARILHDPEFNSEGKRHVGHACTIINGPHPALLQPSFYKVQCNCGGLPGGVSVGYLEPILKQKPELSSWDQIENDTGWTPESDKVRAGIPFSE